MGRVVIALAVALPAPVSYWKRCEFSRSSLGKPRTIKCATSVGVLTAWRIDPLTITSGGGIDNCARG